MKFTLAAVFAGALYGGLAVNTPAVPAARPNVLGILTDDQGYGVFSCHGNPVLKTPALDKLHSQSVRFTDFHVAPICTPSRSQLLTGRDALANGAYCVCSGHEFVNTGLPTMAEVFKSGGYRTGLFGKWHLGDNYPYRPQDRGFQETLSLIKPNPLPAGLTWTEAGFAKPTLL